MITQKINVKVPVTPYVKKYIEKNGYLRNQISLTTSDPVGIVLMACLKKEPVKPSKNNVYVIHTSDFPWDEGVTSSMYLQLLIGEAYGRSCGYFIDDIGIKRFNIFVTKLIKDEAIKYVTIAAGLKMEVKQAIYQFMDMYQFTEDELSYETLRQAYFRSKRKTAQKVEFFMNLSFNKNNHAKHS